MVFAYAAVSAAQKPCQPYGPGHFLSAYRGIYPLHPPYSKFTPYSGRAGRWWFFPGRGRAGGNRGGPRRPSPLNRGKTKGRAWGHGWHSSSHIRPVTYRVFKGCTKCIPIKSGTIRRSSPHSRRFPSAVLPGH
jgi:hypothetical protein